MLKAVQHCLLANHNRVMEVDVAMVDAVQVIVDDRRAKTSPTMPCACLVAHHFKLKGRQRKLMTATLDTANRVIVEIVEIGGTNGNGGRQETAPIVPIDPIVPVDEISDLEVEAETAEENVVIAVTTVEITVTIVEIAGVEFGNVLCCKCTRFTINRGLLDNGSRSIRTGYKIELDDALASIISPSGLSKSMLCMESDDLCLGVVCSTGGTNVGIGTSTAKVLLACWTRSPLLAVSREAVTGTGAASEGEAMADVGGAATEEEGGA